MSNKWFFSRKRLLLWRTFNLISAEVHFVPFCFRNYELLVVGQRQHCCIDAAPCLALADTAKMVFEKWFFAVVAVMISSTLKMMKMLNALQLLPCYVSCQSPAATNVFNLVLLVLTFCKMYSATKNFNTDVPLL